MKMKFYLIVLSLLAVCLWGTGDVRAQSASRSMTVTGKVVDQNGAAVTGASVVVVGTTKGTTTGADGAFSLTGVASDARLAVNFIGYKTQTVEVGGRTSFNIVLVEEATAVELMSYCREKFEINNNYSAADMRIIAGLRY